MVAVSSCSNNTWLYFASQQQLASILTANMNGLDEEAMAPQTFLYGETTSSFYVRLQTVEQ